MESTTFVVIVAAVRSSLHTSSFILDKQPDSDKSLAIRHVCSSRPKNQKPDICFLQGEDETSSTQHEGYDIILWWLIASLAPPVSSTSCLLCLPILFASLIHCYYTRRKYIYSFSSRAQVVLKGASHQFLQKYRYP
jgi:hypothetical protein